MAALAWLLGPGPAEWTSYIGVGLGVAFLGFLVFLLAGGFQHPVTGLVYASFLLSLGLVALGGLTILAGLGLLLWRRRRRGRAPSTA